MSGSGTGSGSNKSSNGAQPRALEEPLVLWRRYADAARIAFKSATRLECMMQDYPKELPATASVGFTVVNQARSGRAYQAERWSRG